MRGHGRRRHGEAVSAVRRGSLVVALVGIVQSAQAAQTIVGTWAPDPTACTPAAGMISIGPLSLTADEMVCTFRDVARSGDVVTWHGRCSDGTTRTPTTVVAALRDGNLTVSMNNYRNGPYRRCRPTVE